MMKVQQLPVIGWREWVGLPELRIPRLRCKVDTGARTSALHAFYVEPFESDGVAMVRFGLHPDEKHTEIEQHCEAAVYDQRNVTDSGGHTEQRYVIRTPIVLGDETWPIEITLTNRDTMKHRMLLGRTAIMDGFLVDTGAQHMMGKPNRLPHHRSILGRRHDEEE